MAEPDDARPARDAVRARERSVWNEVKRVGAELRSRETVKQAISQSDWDAAKKPKEAVEI